MEESYEERRKTCGKCIHDGEGADINGSTCHLCRRNPIADNRIDWFEEEHEPENHEPESYDFSGWVIKYGGPPIYGKVYRKGSLKNNSDRIVPLLWNHNHYDLSQVLGKALLEHRDEGVYAYCTLDGNLDTSTKEDTIKLIRDRGSVSLSPYLNHIKYDGRTVITHGVIREVSLVPERIDRSELYYPVLKEVEDEMTKTDKEYAEIIKDQLSYATLYNPLYPLNVPLGDLRSALNRAVELLEGVDDCNSCSKKLE